MARPATPARTSAPQGLGEDAYIPASNTLGIINEAEANRYNLPQVFADLVQRTREATQRLFNAFRGAPDSHEEERIEEQRELEKREANARDLARQLESIIANLQLMLATASSPSEAAELLTSAMARIGGILDQVSAIISGSLSNTTPMGQQLTANLDGLSENIQQISATLHFVADRIES
jgi:hypothetical protein